MTDYAPARHNMVENQLRPNRVDDPRVLAAMEELPRELFCPGKLKGVAYSDETVEVAPGRYLIEPLVLARLVQAARPAADDVALVLGCDTGYAATVLARMVATVFLLLPDEAATQPVEERLTGLGCDNVVVRVGDPVAGQAEQGPFDVILLGGAVPRVPQNLLDQLGEGGRLVAVVGLGGSGKLTVFTRIGRAFGQVSPFDSALPTFRALLPAPAFEL